MRLARNRKIATLPSRVGRQMRPGELSFIKLLLYVRAPSIVLVSCKACHTICFGQRSVVVHDHEIIVVPLACSARKIVRASDNLACVEERVDHDHLRVSYCVPHPRVLIGKKELTACYLSDPVGKGLHDSFRLHERGFVLVRFDVDPPERKFLAVVGRHGAHDAPHIYLR